MEDFHRAGGLLAVLREVGDLLDPDARTVTGQRLVDALDDSPIWDGEAIRTRAEPLVRDMVRLCDGRMSGTACGTVVLHVAPEAAAGGPLALGRTGDHSTLDVAARRIDVDVPAHKLARRTPTKSTVTAYADPRRGWERLYVDHVLQADTGADLDLLVGSSGSEVSRESH